MHARVHRRWVERLTWMLCNGFHDEYRALLLIHPDQHERLTELLKENETTGDLRWQQMIEQLQSERPPSADDVPVRQLLEQRMALPPKFRNMSNSRLKREFLPSRQRLIDQGQDQEDERITGLSTQHHQTMMTLLEHPMDTGDSNFEEIRRQIEEETRRKLGDSQVPNSQRNG